MNVIITGGTKGIGLACAEMFARHGHQVAVCGRNAAHVNSTLQTLQSIHPSGKHLAICCDVTQRQQLEQFAAACLNNWSRVDVLINNAGIFLPGNLLDEPEGQLLNLIETNLLSAYHFTRLIAPHMMQQKSGYIFNVCSVASIQPYDAGGSYAITKYGLYGFSQNLRHELKPHGVKVTAVIPGATLTSSWEGTTLPPERFIDVTDVATMIYQTSQLSDRTVIEEIVIRPQLGDI